jgi:hypothetical protein
MSEGINMAIVNIREAKTRLSKLVDPVVRPHRIQQV